MYGRLLSVVTVAALALSVTFAHESPEPKTRQVSAEDRRLDRVPPQLFRTADACISCHNGLITPSGEDISFGADWRASMMANSARDPYWQAGVRREVLDHPQAQAAIEDECSICHMPMARFQAKASGQRGEIFAHLPIGQTTTPTARLAADGVSCTLCHQITEDRLGTHESFVGGFVVDTVTVLGQRAVFGPYAVDTGRGSVMHSASGFRQVASTHIQQSELCATCHTLYTEALGPEGELIGKLPEQVPYLEWRHSAYREEQSCQSCHMPVVEDSTAIAAVLGQPRAAVSRHSFRGGNFFVLRMLNRYRAQLGVAALPHELEAAVTRTLDHLQGNTARVWVEDAQIVGDHLQAEVRIENLAGHKLPTAYPSRRAWIHFTVHARDGQLVFESGSLEPSGLIVGNDNDADPRRYEPHYIEITRSDQVQVYEAIMAGPQGEVTTGLLTAVRFVKDNRLLPRGFAKATAHEDVAVQGQAAEDADFLDGGDRVRYSLDVAGAQGPFRVRAELWFQPIAYRWAQNLRPYDAPETDRFLEFYESMSEVSGVILATGAVTVQ
jgi:hypothetical protein